MVRVMALPMAVCLLALVLAGCSNSGGGGGATSTSGSPLGGGNFTTPGAPLATKSGLPVVGLNGDMDLQVTLAADGRVHRVRLLSSEAFALGQVSDAQDDGGGGGGGGGGLGGGGGNSNPPVGIALFATDRDPSTAPPCSDAAEHPALDGRTTTEDPSLAGKAGLSDLWLWSGGPTTVIIEVDGGGSPKNVTAQVHNWTATLVEPAVTKSGPAQTTASFDAPLSVTKAALFLGQFTPPTGYPSGESSTTVAAGATCAEGVATGGGGGFRNSPASLLVKAFLGSGAASWSGTFAAPASPTGEGTATGVLVQPA